MTFDILAVRGPVEHPIAEGVEAADALDAASRVVGDGCVLLGARWRGDVFRARLRHPNGMDLVVVSRPATVPREPQALGRRPAPTCDDAADWLLGGNGGPACDVEGEEVSE